MQLRCGMNPHQAARVTGRPPVRVVSGTASYLNLLDALTGWQLVREAAAVTRLPAAASIKHVSPAGVAVAGPLDDTARETWGLAADVGAPTAAYVRARDADPKSSYGDMVAVSEPVDAELAGFLARVVADGVIAPGFEPGTMPVLAAKKRGTFVVLEADPVYLPPEWEQREVFGVSLAQQRDAAPVTADLLSVSTGGPLPPDAVVDALLGLVTVRYTQSNSVALMRDGAALGIAAGQQNRVDCVQLAARKAAAWWLRRHEMIRGLPAVACMPRQDRLNWQLRMTDADMTLAQRREFGALFGSALAVLAAPTRREWLGQLGEVTLVSDGYLPFRDNIDEASRIGVGYIIEPGGSGRAADIEAACAEYGMTLARTGLRLFRH
jgi:phosphoribosylaminoimidazolecarboxamide formyltransferase / IMP cyclohydrolase